MKHRAALMTGPGWKEYHEGSAHALHSVTGEDREPSS
jgi:hypothetical protein